MNKEQNTDLKVDGYMNHFGDRMVVKPPTIVFTKPSSNSVSCCNRGVDFHQATPQPTEVEEIDMAKAIIYGDREKTYGHPALNLQRIAALWSTYFQIPITPEQVCWAMVLLKASREMNESKQDNRVDAMGYLALIGRIASFNKQQEEVCSPQS